jgi:hypothetical protein
VEEPAQTHRGAQFEGFRILPLRNAKSLTEIRLRLILRSTAAGLKNQDAAQAVKLRFVEVRPASTHLAERSATSASASGLPFAA